jgi:hypothetical protein
MSGLASSFVVFNCIIELISIGQIVVGARLMCQLVSVIILFIALRYWALASSIAVELCTHFLLRISVIYWK